MLTVAGGEIQTGSASVGTARGGISVVVEGADAVEDEEVDGRLYLFLSLLKETGRLVGFQKPRELKVMDGGCGRDWVVKDEVEDPGKALPRSELVLVASEDPSELSSQVLPAHEDVSAVLEGSEPKVLDNRLDIRLLSLSSCMMLDCTFTVVL